MSETPFKQFVRIIVVSLNDEPEKIDCPLEIGGNYQTYAQNAIQNGLFEMEDWFTKTDLTGRVWAFRLSQIRFIRAAVVNE